MNNPNVYSRKSTEIFKVKLGKNYKRKVLIKFYIYSAKYLKSPHQVPAPPPPPKKKSSP